MTSKEIVVRLHADDWTRIREMVREVEARGCGHEVADMEPVTIYGPTEKATLVLWLDETREQHWLRAGQDGTLMGYRQAFVKAAR